MCPRLPSLGQAQGVGDTALGTPPWTAEGSVPGRPGTRIHSLSPQQARLHCQVEETPTSYQGAPQPGLSP